MLFYLYDYFPMQHQIIYIQSNQNVFRHLEYFSHFQFIHYSLENRNKISQELELNKFILIMSDTFDREVCNELGGIAVNCQLLNLSTQLDNTNLDQPVTKQCYILFTVWCKKVALEINVKTLNQNMVRSKSLNRFRFHMFYSFYW